MEKCRNSGSGLVCDPDDEEVLLSAARALRAVHGLWMFTGHDCALDPHPEACSAVADLDRLGLAFLDEDPRHAGPLCGADEGSGPCRRLRGHSPPHLAVP